ncbi:MAG: FtsK/SpoIIIE domain-containing protein [Phycisphaerales bacterium]
MTSGPLTDRVRALIGDFSLLLGDRARRHREIDEALERGRAQIVAEHERAREAAIAQHARTMHEARERAQRETREHVTPLEQQLEAARQTLGVTLSTIRERAASDDAAIEKWLTDRVWMADSLYETSSPKPGEQFEVMRRELGAAGEKLRQIEERGARFLRACRMGRLERPPAPEGAASWGESDASRRLNEMSQASEARARQLERMILPRAFAGLWPVAWVMMAGAGAAAAAGARTGWSDTRALLVGAGAGVLAGVALLVLARWWAQRRVQDVRAGLGFALAEARAAGERWLELAAEQRRRAEAHIRHTRETDVRSAHTKAAAKRDELNRARREKSHHAEEAHAGQTRELQARHDAAAAAILQSRQAAEREADRRRDQALREADEARERASGELQERTARSREELRAWYISGMRAALSDSRERAEMVRAACVPWNHPLWGNAEAGPGSGGWRPSEVAPPALAVGWLSLDLAALPGGLTSDAEYRVEGVPESRRIELPLSLELPDRCSMVVKTGAAGRSDALALLQSTMLRVLTTFPPGKARFTILDPVGLGQNFAAFMHLADYEPALVGDRIWTEPRHIEQRLTDLTEHMENVIQKYLRNQFRTIEEYNAHAGEVAEPYRFLVVADLPSGFNEIAAKRLASILDSGPRCGVYTLIAWDTRQALPQGLMKNDLAKAPVQLTWKGSAFASDDAAFGVLPLRIEAPPADDRFNALVHMVGRQAKDRSRVQVPFEMIAPPAPTSGGEAGAGLWVSTSAREVTVPIGRAGATKLQHLTLGRGTAQHALIAGRTGSGKSTLLHALITSLATWYAPDEVELYLVDFKKGVEFKTYAAHEVPHARVIAIESEREFGLSVLRRLDAELKRRGELFRAAETQDIAGYRSRHPGERMPRVLLIVDEFQELFVEDDKLAQEASLLLDRLVRQGRAFGMHAVLGSQTLGGAYSLARSTIGQMAVRIALQCSEADSYLILSDDNPAARLLSRPGEAIYNDASGAIEGNSPFQVAWLPEEKRDHYLELVQARQRRAESAGPPREPAIVFEGSAPARVERNPALSELLAGRGTVRPGAIAAWIGEPIAIRESTAAVFRRQSAANLLIVGQKDESALAMFTTAAVSIAAQCRRRDAGDSKGNFRMHFLDGTPADASTAGHLDEVARHLGTEARITAYRDVDRLMRELAGEVERRAASEQPDALPIFVFIYGLQRFRSLRRPENEFDFGGSDGADAAPDKLFLKLLREGPATGVHTLVWVDTVSSFNRTLERSALREFDQRVLFQMSAADSSALIDVATAGLIGPNRALFASEEQGTIEKFRPYALPERSWLAGCAEQIR